MIVALVGGQGFIGRHCVRALVAAGHRPIVLSRQTDPPRAPDVEARRYLPDDPASWDNALRGVQALVFLPGLLHGTARDFRRVHVDLTQAALDACARAGIRRYIQISALGAALDAPSDYQRSKGEAERRVMASGLDWTILRPSVVFGRGDSFLGLFARLVRFLPVLPLAGADARFQPVWVEDVAAAVVGCLERPVSVGSRYDLVGPRVYPLRDIVRFCAETQGRRIAIVPLPDGLARLQAWIMEKLPHPLLSRDNLRSMTVDNISPAGFPTLFGREPAAMETVAPAYLRPRRADEGAASGR